MSSDNTDDPHAQGEPFEVLLSHLEKANGKSVAVADLPTPPEPIRNIDLLRICEANNWIFYSRVPPELLPDSDPRKDQLRVNLTGGGAAYLSKCRLWRHKQVWIIPPPEPQPEALMQHEQSRAPRRKKIQRDRRHPQATKDLANLARQLVSYLARYEHIVHELLRSRDPETSERAKALLSKIYGRIVEILDNDIFIAGADDLIRPDDFNKFYRFKSSPGPGTAIEAFSPARKLKAKAMRGLTTQRLMEIDALASQVEDIRPLLTDAEFLEYQQHLQERQLAIDWLRSEYRRRIELIESNRREFEDDAKKLIPEWSNDNKDWMKLCVLVCKHTNIQPSEMRNMTWVNFRRVLTVAAELASQGRESNDRRAPPARTRLYELVGRNVRRVGDQGEGLRISKTHQKLLRAAELFEYRVELSKLFGKEPPALWLGKFNGEKKKRDSARREINRLNMGLADLNLEAGLCDDVFTISAF